MSDLKNILNLGPDINEDALKRYLNGTASEEERFAIENQMADEAFMNDAVEGLQNFNDPALMDQYVNAINKEIQVQTSKKKDAEKTYRRSNWTLISVILIIVLCILGYFVIHLSTKDKKAKQVIEQKNN